MISSSRFRREGAPSVLVAIILVLLGPALGAATYYVDFDSGSDANAGTSAAAPWKRCPGDSKATGVPAGTALVPGDSVLFKGGVVYRGSMNLIWSGADGNPIRYAGNQWGSGKAILDGSDVFTANWTKCVSAADCRGNANWANVYWTPIPSGASSVFRTILYNGSDFCYFAQDPNPTNRVFFDVLADWHPVAPANITTTSLRDTSYFTQADPDYWDDCWVGRWVYGNALSLKPITSFSPSARTIYYADGGSVPYSDRESYYTIIGQVAHIDQPGEYAYSTAENRLYIWPPGSVNPATYTFSMATRVNAFNDISQNNLSMTGFQIRGYFADLNHVGYGGCAVSLTGTPGRGDSRNVTFSNNDVSLMRSMKRSWLITAAHNGGVVIASNSVTRSFGGGAFASNGNGIVVRSNYFSNITGTAIYTPGATNSLISSNVLRGILGIHANGISVYSYADNVEISYNEIRNVYTPITYEYSRNLRFLNNLVDANGMDQRISEWGGCTGTIWWINNTLVNTPEDVILNIGLTGSQASYVIKNNIIDGGGPQASVTASVRSDNIYVGRAWWQDSNYGWALRTGEFDHTALSTLFANPGARDWSLAPGSPAIDAGVDASGDGVKTSLLGVPRPAGPAYDIGAYEFGGASSAPAAPRNVRVL